MRCGKVDSISVGGHYNKTDVHYYIEDLAAEQHHNKYIYSTYIMPEMFSDQLLYQAIIPVFQKCGAVYPALKEHLMPPEVVPALVRQQKANDQLTMHQ